MTIIIINITKYSARPFTNAKKMNGRLKTEIVKERSRIFTDLSNKISFEKNSTHMGKKYNILITEIGKKIHLLVDQKTINLLLLGKK